MHTVVFYTRVKERDGVIVKFVTNLSGLTSALLHVHLLQKVEEAKAHRRHQYS